MFVQLSVSICASNQCSDTRVLTWVATFAGPSSHPLLLSGAKILSLSLGGMAEEEWLELGQSPGLHARRTGCPAGLDQIPSHSAIPPRMLMLMISKPLHRANAFNQVGVPRPPSKRQVVQSRRPRAGGLRSID